MAKSKILVIPGYRIFPIDSGGAHGQLTFLDKQQHQFEVYVILTPENINHSDITAFATRFPQLKLVPIGFDIKKDKSIGAFFRKQIRKASGKDFSYLSRKVQQINGYFISNPHLISALTNYINTNLFELIQVEHLRNAGLVSVLPKTTRKIFIQHEVGFLRVYEDLKSLGYPDAYASYLAGFAEGAELYYMQQYDGVVTFNEDDVSLLRAKGITVPLQVASPFALFDDELNNIYQAADKPALIFIGGEEHYPNKDGFTWFVEKIFPQVLKSNKDIILYVTSKWSTEHKNRYQTENIVFTGFVESLDDLIANSILVTPIRIGSGIRVKVFTSMAKGVPVVSTTLGASGIPDLENGKNILLADTEADFTSCIIELIKDEKLRKEISEGGYRLASRNFTAMKFVEERNTFYKQVMNSDNVIN